MRSDGHYSVETPYFIFANKNDTVRDRHTVCSMGCNFVSDLPQKATEWKSNCELVHFHNRENTYNFLFS